MGLLKRIRRWFRGKSGEIPPRAVVLLLKDPIAVEQETLRTRIAASWNIDIGISDDEASEKGLLVAAIPTSVIMLGGEMYIVNSFGRPYADHPEEFASRLPDLRQRKVIMESKAWMSVDLIRPESPSSEEMAFYYGKLCRLAAEFVTDNCSGVYLPENGVLRSNDPELQACLRNPNPLGAIGNHFYAPVFQPSSEDALQAAVVEARRRWPELWLLSTVEPKISLSL